MPVFSRFHRYFLGVARYGSIRKAAEELNVSASAVDRQILQAEAELGTALFERQHSGLRLTAAGELLMTAGARWEKGLATVRTQIEDLRGLRRGHVEVAVIDALSAGYLQRLVRRVREHHPGLTLGVRVLDNLKVRDAILTGEVDLGIYLEPQSYRDIVVRAHCDVALGFVVSPGHSLAKKSGVRFSACSGHKVVLPAQPLAVHEQMSLLVASSGLSLDVAASSDNIVMLKSLILEGVGIGILTWIDVIPEVTNGLLQFVEITDAILRPMTLALCIASSRTLSSAANLVLADAELHFSELAREPTAATHGQDPVPRG